MLAEWLPLAVARGPGFNPHSREKILGSKKLISITAIDQMDGVKAPTTDRNGLSDLVCKSGPRRVMNEYSEGRQGRKNKQIP